MKPLLRAAYGSLIMFGVDPRKTLSSLRGLPSFVRDFQTLRKQRRSATEEFRFGSLYPCPGDRYSDSGSARGHYFHQDLLVARRVYLNNPNMHVDVGSRVDGLIAHLASFRPVEVIDIRPLSSSIPNVRFLQADIMAPVSDSLIGYCDSLSCLHALEHFGLGRYGDPVNHEGHLLGLQHLGDILRKGGKFYLSVPIGPQRIEFNAHRVFSIGYLQERFAGKYQIDQFSFVDDGGDLHENVPLTASEAKENFGCMYGCGIFEMTKL